jgi:transcriptional regulator with XRE-family HTH domain
VGFLGHPPLAVTKGELCRGDTIKFIKYESKKQAINSKVIKQIRQKLNISQEKMAEILETDRGRLSKVERGLETPDWLIKFAALSYLLHESGMSWNDVIMTLPDPSPRASEKPTEYKPQ